ncbi:MAG TPA: hypothetical protein VE646_05335 [Actinomycetota bacterium]|nr:hypothetical protein [Actinomycetota bacterium]
MPAPDQLDLWQWIGVFGLSAAVLVVAGTSLAKWGDEIATRTGLSGLLIGSLLAATATSLPELVIGVSASVSGAPALAVSDMFGSNMANMAILAVVDLMGRHRVWPVVELGHARVASIAIALTAFAALGVIARPDLTVAGWVGADTLFIGVAYVSTVAWMRRSRVSRVASLPGEGELPVPTGWSEPGRRGDVAPAALRFGAAAALILASAPFVTRSAEGIAVTGGLSESFVGTAMLAVASSLPELVASLAAVRIGAHDLAVGNLFGSNAMNMAMLLIFDLVYPKGPILAAVGGPGEATAAVASIALMGLTLAAIVHGEETRIRRLEPDAVVVLLAYLAAMWAVWAASV